MHKNLFLLGAKSSIPLILGAIPFGVIFGTLAINNGLSVIEAMAMSAIVFAGSAQFIAIGLFAIQSPIEVILITTFIVNLRHILYSITLIEFVKHLSLKWRIFLAFGLTDESFAIVKKFYDDHPHDDNENKNQAHWFYAGSIVFFYSCWQIATWLGIFLGKSIPNLENLGLDFAMYVTFIGIIASYLTTKAMWLSLFTAGVLSVALMNFPHQLGLTLAAIGSMFIATTYESYMIKRNKL